MDASKPEDNEQQEEECIIIKEHHRKDKNKTPEEKLRDELRTRIDIITYQHKLKYLEHDLELESQRARIKVEEEISNLEHKSKRQKLSHQIEMLDLQLELCRKQNEFSQFCIEKTPTYLKNPIRTITLEDNTQQIEITISDRLIRLNDVINQKTASRISQQLSYFNNQCEEKPIFLIIGYCIGGEVMAGHCILQALQSSVAPIYVIVESYAGSMAATIATLANHSYIFPNAMMMHHEIMRKNSNMMNLTQREEDIQSMQESWKRYATPVANKLGYTLKQWRKMLRENNSETDWTLYGDEAVSNGWVNSLVHRLKYTNILLNPQIE